MDIRRGTSSSVDVKGVERLPDHPAASIDSWSVAWLRRNRIVDDGDDWEIVVAQPRLWALAFGVFVLVLLPGLVVGLRWMWRHWFYWLGLIALIAVAAVVVRALRSSHTTIAKVGAVVEVRTFAGGVTRLPLASLEVITYCHLTDRVVRSGEFSTTTSHVPDVYVGLRFENGATLSYFNAALAPVLARRLHAAAPNARIAIRSPERPQTDTIDILWKARARERPGASQVAFGLSWLGAAGALVFASGAGWVAAKPDIMPIGAAPVHATLGRIAADLPPADAERSINALCVHPDDAEYFWDGDTLAHRVVGRGVIEDMSEVRSEQLREIAADRGLRRTGEHPDIPARSQEHYELTRDDVTLSVVIVDVGDSGAKRGVIIAETACLAGSSAPTSTLEAMDRIVADLIGAPT